MEGKEVRFGIAASSLFATVTTDSSSGAVNAMHDSFMPLSGGLLMANMMLDEVIVGGVGSGLFGMLLFCIVTVFLGGLMVGRTPEYVGKKIQADEVKMTMLALLCVPGTILLLTSVASTIAPGLAGIANQGPHGFSEILYAYTSAAATNGSAFAGLNANTPFYNLTLVVRHVPWPLPGDRSGPCHCRVACGEAHHAVIRWHLADNRHPLRCLADRRDCDCRRASPSFRRLRSARWRSTLRCRRDFCFEATLGLSRTAPPEGLASFPFRRTRRTYRRRKRAARNRA